MGTFFAPTRPDGRSRPGRSAVRRITPSALVSLLLGVASLAQPLSVEGQNLDSRATPADGFDRISETDTVPRILPNDGSERGWLGIAFRDPADRNTVPDASRRGGPGRNGSEINGVVVSGVLRGSPADRAGIRPGHVLLRLDGNEIGPRELTRRAREIQVGDSVRLTLRGPGGERQVELVAAPRPERLPPALDPDVMARVDSIQEAVRRRLESLRQRLESDRGDAPGTWFRVPRGIPEQGAPPRSREELRSGMPGASPERRRPPRPYSLGREFVAGARMAPLNAPLAEYFGVDGGVLTLEVLEDSPAAEAGLQPGDVIVALDDEEMESVADLRAALLGRRSPSAELRVVRRGEELTIRLPP